MDAGQAHLAAQGPLQALAPEQLQQSQWVAAPVGVPAAPAAPGSAPSAFLRLRGLPFSAQEQDIRAFFGPEFELAQVFVCKRNGRSNGEAYVQLADPSQAPTALARLHRALLGPRYIELFEALEGDLATARALAIDRLRGYVIRLRGLPFNASPNDVLRFLSGVEVVRGAEGIIFTWTPDGRPTGEAFVELQDEEAQREAMKKHKERMGTRYIEIFTSTKSALIQAIQHNRLVLGLAERKRWLQQAGLPAGAGTTTLLVSPGGGVGVGAPMQVAHLVAAPGQRIEDVTDTFAGMTLGQGLPLRGPAQHIQLHSGGVAAQPGLLLQQAGGVTTIYNAPGLPAGMQVTAYQPGPSAYPGAAQHVMPATAQAGQLLQMSQPGSTSSVATSTYGTTTTLQLGGHPAAALGGGGGGAVVVQPHHHLQLLQQQHQQQQELMGGSPPPQQAQQAQHAQQAQQYITMESSQSSVASAYASVPNSAEHLARGGQQQYLVPQPGGGYALQTVQLRPTATAATPTTIHELLQLGHAGGAPAPGTMVQDLSGHAGLGVGTAGTYHVQAYGGAADSGAGIMAGDVHVVQQQ